MDRLAVAVIHYHLRPGGVTRVIERAVDSLNDQVDVLVLSGEAPAPNDLLTPISEPFQPLEYNSNPAPADAKKRCKDLRFTARNLLGRDPDIWHIHNHALGKNSFTPQLVRHLADAGCRLLLQPHDFAEDGRSRNYRLLTNELQEKLNRILYPTADHIWYAPINYRDKSFLEASGIPNVYELPNAVTAHESKPAGAPTKTIVYPARAIRRKNLGEFLLWSLLAPEGYRFQSTLAPQNPVWRNVYDSWVQFADELNLPVELDAGRTHDFPELIQNAEALMTTSIQEGFGLAFLEPWLEGKALIGRKLPEITTDFEEEGLDLSMLYNKLPVPLKWAGEKAFLNALEAAMIQTYEAYGKTWKPDMLTEAKMALIKDEKVDFGILNEELQRNVIRHLAEHPDDRKTLPALNLSTSSTLLEANRNVAEQNYSKEAYGTRLMNLYRELASVTPSTVSAIPAENLLDQFLKPSRMNLLRA
jgi:glycosyltransferase involved in cell wall biosynthesis